MKLAESYGISVLPVRQALRALEEEGLITRRRGSGTYVSKLLPMSNVAVTSLESLYSHEFTRPALILELGEVTTPAKFASYFPSDTELMFIRRLAFRDDIPGLPDATSPTVELELAVGIEAAFMLPLPHSKAA